MILYNIHIFKGEPIADQNMEIDSTLTILDGNKFRIVPERVAGSVFNESIYENSQYLKISVR